MPYPRIKLIHDEAGLASDMFWDSVANVEVMPQEVAARYNDMAHRLDLMDAAAREVARIVQAVSSVVGYKVTPTERTIIDGPYDEKELNLTRTGGLSSFDKPVHRNYQRCTICGHVARQHSIPPRHGGERFPLRVLQCLDCPQGKCVLPDDPKHPGRSL